MPRGYRLFFIAAFGWLALCAQHTNPNARQEQRQAEQPIANSAGNSASLDNEQPKGAKRQIENEPCKAGDDRRYSDLCAQWKAADAAEKAAWWARVSGILSVAGLVGVAGALFLTVRSNDIARDTAKRQLRAYLSWDSVTMNFQRGADGAVLDCRIQVVWKNGGQTPANEFNGDGNWDLFQDGLPADYGYPNSPDAQESGCLVVGPQATVTTAVSRKMTLAEFQAVSSGKKRAFVWAWAAYTDVFGAMRRSEVAFEVAIEALANHQHDVGFQATGPHNGMDNDCFKQPSRKNGDTL